MYDIASGVPREVQVVSVPNSFGGLAFDPGGAVFYVSGGPDDSSTSLGRDVAAGRWEESVAAVDPARAPRREVPGSAAWATARVRSRPGLAVNRVDGTTVVVANHENDSLSLVDVASGSLRGEVPLRPGGGAAGGEYPLDVAIVGPHAFVTSERDRELVEVDLVAGRCHAAHPRRGPSRTALVANRAGTRLYVANAGSATPSRSWTSPPDVPSSVTSPRPPPPTPFPPAIAPASRLQPQRARISRPTGARST